MDSGHWDISLVGEFDPCDWWGFVYEIEQISTGKLYIGKKQLRFKRTRTKSNPARTKESDWKFYSSSCEPLNEAVQEEGKDNFHFRILSLCVGRCQLTYEEQQIQFTRDVLRARLPNGERQYWNRTIGHLLFAGVEKQTAEAKLKISLGNTGKVRTPEARQRYSESKKGIPKTPEHRALLAEANTGKVHTPETNAKRSRSMSALRWWTDGHTSCRSVDCPGPEWRLGRQHVFIGDLTATPQSGINPVVV